MLSTRAIVVLASVVVIATAGGAAASSTATADPGAEYSQHATTDASVQYAEAGVQYGQAADAGVEARQQDDDDEEEENPDVFVRELVIDNVTTTMEVERANATVERDGETRNVTRGPMTVTLENASAVINNATVDDGVVNVTSGTVNVTRGSVEMASDDGNRTMEVTNHSIDLDNESFVLQDLVGGVLGMEDLENATITEMRVEGVSMEGDVPLALTNTFIETPDVEEPLLHSASVRNGSYSVENATVTMENVTIEDGAVTAENATVTVESAELTADQITLIDWPDIHVREDVNRTVTNETITATDVRFSANQTQGVLERMLAESLVRNAVR